MSNPFSLLGIEPSFSVDFPALEKRYRDIARAVHPDKADAASRREAAARSVDLNAALRTLKDPIKRAEALLGVLGVAIGDGREPQPSPALLMDVLEQREALAEAKAARDAAKVAKLADAMRSRETALLDALGAKFRDAIASGRAEAESLQRSVGELRYVRRFLDEADAIAEDLAENG